MVKKHNRELTPEEIMAGKKNQIFRRKQAGTLTAKNALV
jgi:hypothetical protein